MVKFPIEHRVGEVKNDQVTTKENYFNSIRDQGQQKKSFNVSILKIQPPKGDYKLKSRDETWTLMIDEKTGCIVNVKAQLEELTKQQLEGFWKQTIDVLVYNIEEMTDMDLNTMVHRLNVKTECRLIKQKKRSFALERQELIKEEIQN